MGKSRLLKILGHCPSQVWVYPGLLQEVPHPSVPALAPKAQLLRSSALKLPGQGYLQCL